ncbi:hypothetical protein AN641_01425 [Candidatus Epulonipiscioides gigas]|nr:hypothetical protein AN641_01425 [Epulopiscium sp. SCG-C07WGA-EpuloA2]
MPNVIVIVTDDQGYPDVACNGNPYLSTPNLDKMYDRGIHLEDFHTDPMCAPTRAGFLTGQYSMRVGVWSTLNGRYYLNKDVKTIGNYFQDAGYKTGIFGKWHMGDNYPYKPGDRGFDRVVTFGGGVVGETPDYWNNDYFDDTYEKDGQLVKYKGYCTDIWFEETIEFIKENKDKPFFCYIPTNAPHSPYNVDPKYKEPYLKMGMSDKLASFYGMITNIDDNVGKLEKSLQEMGLLEDTIIVFFGDNGSSGVITDQNGWVKEGYNANMRGKKGQVFEGSHKNSCFIRWDGGDIGAPRGVTGITAQIDLLPTLLDCCNIPNNPDDFDGYTMYEKFKKGKTNINIHRTLVIHRMQLDYPRKYKDFTVLTPRYRFIKTKNNGKDSIMLFDMEKDFSQTTNIIGEHTEDIGKYFSIYEKWWNDVTTNGQYDYSYIPIGHDSNEVMLTAHSWHGNESLAYDQIHIRKGIDGSGYWTLEVEQDGLYSFSLRRWPKESELPISSSVEAIAQDHRIHERPEGKIYNVTKAVLIIDGQHFIKDVNKDDLNVDFEVELKSGKAPLQTWFICENGECLGAYYIYINKK